jgi:hypothetical protein
LSAVKILIMGRHSSQLSMILNQLNLRMHALELIAIEAVEPQHIVISELAPIVYEPLQFKPEWTERHFKDRTYDAPNKSRHKKGKR